MDLPIYMDHHATTPVDPRVVDAMLPYFTRHYGNAASRHHAFGWTARDAVETARAQVAALVDCDPRELYFTSGATESNNLVLKGCGGSSQWPAHVVTSATEHPAILDPCRRLEAGGAKVDYVTPDSDGRLAPEEVDAALRDDTSLLSVMAANNETGVLQPIEELAALARARGVRFHTDATQAIGKVPLSAAHLDIDFLSLSAHKIYGPKGVGALYVRRRRPRLTLQPLLDGGGHERGLRSGTLNVPAIVGFGRAAEICRQELADEVLRVGRLRDRLWTGLSDRLVDIQVNGSLAFRLPHNLNVGFHGVEGESLLVGLEDVAISSGAACMTVSSEPSHVLTAMGVPKELARASLRFGLGRWNTSEEVDFVVNKVSGLVASLRRGSLR